MPPKVSILLPVYKAEKYISQCIQSILGQTYNNLEIVIVNDASPDSSMDIIKDIIKNEEKQYEIKIVNNCKNQGIASVRNKLLDHSSGNYILFVDSDDYIESTAVESLVTIAENTQCDIVRSSYYEVKDNCIRTILQKPWNDKTHLLKQHISAWDSIEAMWQLFIRRSLIEDNNLRFATGINAAEDHLMITKLYFFANSIVDSERAVYYYRTDNIQSLTHINSLAFSNSMYNAMDNAITFLKEKGAYEIYREELLTRTFLTKQTFLLNKKNRDIDRYLYTHPESNSFYRKFKYTPSQLILFKLAESQHRFILKILTHILI